MDIWPLGLLHPGAVTVNVAIDIAATVTLRPRASGYRLVADGVERTTEDAESWRGDSETALVGHLATVLDLPPADIEVESDSPRGGGLGASSAIAMAMIAAAEELAGVGASTVEHRSRIARDVEARMMGLPTGRQDHLPAALGGLLAIAHEPGGDRYQRLEADLEALGSSLIVVYTGQSHFSAGNNWRIVRRRLDGDVPTVEHFEHIARIAQAVVRALRAGELATVGRLMSEEWLHRRVLAEGISTARIEAILEVGRAAGAWGGKACGAGGGGCIAFLAPPERRGAVVAALSETAEVLAASPCERPLELHVDPS